MSTIIFIKNSLIEKKKLNLKYVCLCHETAIVVVFSFFRNKFQNKIQTLYVVFKLLPQYKRYYALTLYRLLLLLYIAELLSINSSIFAIQTTLLCSGCCWCVFMAEVTSAVSRNVSFSQSCINYKSNILLLMLTLLNINIFS